LASSSSRSEKENMSNKEWSDESDLWISSSSLSQSKSETFDESGKLSTSNGRGGGVSDKCIRINRLENDSDGISPRLHAGSTLDH